MNKKLLSILALSMLLASCNDPVDTSSESKSDNPSVEDSSTTVEPSTGDSNSQESNEPVLPESIKVSGNVSNLVDGALAGATISYNGKEITTDVDGNFTIEDVKDYQTAKLAVSKVGYLSKEVNLSTYFDGDEEANVSVSLAKYHALIGTTIDKDWSMYGKFTMAATRDAEGLHIQLVSLNTSWLSNEVLSWVEVYISTGLDTSVRGEGHYKLALTNSNIFTVEHYGQAAANRNLFSYNAAVENETNTVINYYVPFAAINATSEDVIGLSMGEWNDSIQDWALMSSAVNAAECPVESPASYVRIDKTNKVFANAYNCDPSDNPKPKYNKEELIVGYPINFAITGVAHALADDIYVKFEKTDTAFVFDMIGFGSLAENEYIKTIIHAGSAANSGWGLSTTDLSILSNKTAALTKTNITDYWQCEKLGQTDGALSVAPEYVLHDEGYFTYKLTVPFADIPQYSADEKYSVLFVEHGDIIYNEKWDQGMFYNGVSCGDAASQGSYIPIQIPQYTKVDEFDSYPVQFGIDANNQWAALYAKFERNYDENKLVLKIGGYGDFASTSFIRFIVKDGSDLKTGVWELASTDMSFTIYKDIVYYQTGQTWFWDNERNEIPFCASAENTTIYTPVYTYNEETNSFTLEVSFDFSEIVASEVTDETSLRGLLVLFAPSIVGGPVYTQNGIILGDPANQSNYLVI